VGILKRVIVTPAVYPRFFKFLHVDIQSTGHTLSRRWSRQSNDVMSEILHLHNELRRRHSRLQLHGLFTLAKHLLCLCSLFSEYTEVKNVLRVTPEASDESFILDTATTGHSLTLTSASPWAQS